MICGKFVLSGEQKLVSESKSGKEEVQSFSERFSVVFAKVLMEGGRLFQKIGAVC